MILSLLLNDLNFKSRSRFSSQIKSGNVFFLTCNIEICAHTRNHFSSTLKLKYFTWLAGSSVNYMLTEESGKLLKCDPKLSGHGGQISRKNNLLSVNVFIERLWEYFDLYTTRIFRRLIFKYFTWSLLPENFSLLFHNFRWERKGNPGGKWDFTLREIFFTAIFTLPKTFYRFYMVISEKIWKYIGWINRLNFLHDRFMPSFLLSQPPHIHLCKTFADFLRTSVKGREMRK